MHRSTLLLRWLAPAALFALLGLAGCGGGSSNSIVSPPSDDGGGTPPVAIADLSLVASSTQIPSDGSAPVTVSAIVRDANNAVVEGQTVIFSADSGALKILSSTTNQDGVAQAELSLAGDPTNRTITVTAAAAGLTETIGITAFGTTLTVTGPTSVVFNDTVQYSVRLRNSGGAGISGTTVDVASAAGNTLSAASLVTNSQGEATFSLTGSVAGGDTLTATALGIEATHELTVSNDSFAFLSPNAGQEINLGTNVNVTVEWLVGGAPQAGQQVTFSTTRGTLSATSATTDGSGRATVMISSNNSGVATLGATADGAPTIQRQVEFVATEPAKISVQASRFSVEPGGQSTITARVRDANDNLVKNEPVDFSLQDTTGGVLSPGPYVTNSFGEATVTYTAGNVVSASNGVVITGTVTDSMGLDISGQVALTVAQQEVDIAIGTDNTIQEQVPDYIKTFSVRVTDSQGVGIEGVPVQLTVFSKNYIKGMYVAGADSWIATPSVICPDEDANRNGQLDPGEDLNDSGNIEAGFVAAVSPGTVTTNAQGAGNFQISYAQEFGSWVEVTIQARASVTGTEFLEQQSFVLSISQADASLDQSPPGGLISRWGNSAICFDTL